MAIVKVLDPVSRIEGHLKIEVTIDTVNGKQQVVDAKVGGTLFRGFEMLLMGRPAYDAIALTQRICGVCPVAHAYAASLAMDAVSKVATPSLGRVMRNFVLAANFLQSHVLHFYHLAALDFFDPVGTAVYHAPWAPTHRSDLRIKGADAAKLVANYVTALGIRRRAHELGAVFGGKLPHPAGFVPGGFTGSPKAEQIAKCRTIISEIAAFIDGTWLPDVTAIGNVYDDYFTLGAGPKNLLSFGCFDLDATGTSKLLPRGRVVQSSSTVQTMDAAKITEAVSASWYTDAPANPATGTTTPAYGKAGAYSWLKAPRYENQVYEVGPLARMWMSGDHRRGVSVLDRHIARAKEAKKLVAAMPGWLDTMAAGGSRFTPPARTPAGSGFGLVEAARGALGHWTDISAGNITRYQVITPTCWNAAPRDNRAQPGALEQALVGTPVLDAENPIEVLRVIHSFDPCVDCATHVTRAGSKTPVAIVQSRSTP